MTDILSILHSIGYTNLKDLGQNYSCRPLYRLSDNDTALAINKTTGLWYDFVEQRGGSLPSLIKLTLGLKSLEDVKPYLKDLPVSVDAGELVELKETKKFNKALLTKLLKDNSYWNSRGISNEVLNKFNGGIAQNGRMAGRWVFPIICQRDDLIGFAGRLIEKNDYLVPWKLIGSKTNWVFPYFCSEEIKKKKKVALVESLGDCVSLLELGISYVRVLFGLVISSAVIMDLLKNDVNEISIILNNDSKNNFAGDLAAQKTKKELQNYFDEDQIKIITPPENDLNEMLVRDKEGLKDFCYQNGIV